MCLTVGYFNTRQKARDVIPKIAKRNIWVWKMLEDYGYQLDKENQVFYAPYKYTPYKLGEEKESKLSKKIGSYNCLYVNKGLHSFLSRKEGKVRVNERSIYTGSLNFLFPAVIPKGSLYYISHDKTEIVSTRLIVYPVKHKKVPKSASKEKRKIT